MRKLNLIIKSIIKVWWFFIIPVIVMFIHYEVNKNFDIDNKLISLVLQIIGGSFILYSIDCNLELISNSSLRLFFVSKIKICPWKKCDNIVNIPTGSIEFTGYPGKVRVGGAANTIENLQQQIDWIKDDFKDEISLLKKRIGDIEQSTNSKILEHGLSIKEVERKVNDLGLGDIEIQLFGFVMLIYGSIVSYIE